MAKTPSEKYASGELQRTRERLGSLSNEEATRMAEILGGEVGVERTDEKIEKQYEELKRKHTKPSGYVHPSKGRQYKLEENKALLKPPGKVKKEKRGPHPSYAQRIKMNFLAANENHRIMRKIDAVASLFSFVIPVKECINPDFIRESDDIFFRRIENLVLSVRSLLAINKKSKTQRMRPSFFLDILIVIRNWDIESLHWELSQLQKRPRRLSFSECSSLCKEVYKPLIVFMNLDPYSHIEGALKRLYELDLLSVAKGSKTEEKVITCYRAARDEIPYIFQDLRYRFYPLMLKLLSDVYYSFTMFFTVKYKDILDFVGIEEKEIIAPKRVEETEDESEGESGDETPSKETPDTEQVEAEHEEEEKELPHEIARGLELLECIFPHAGWDKIRQFPDFYAYFQPLFSYPRGVELIPPEDPLLLVIILVSIIQEFFYGFRYIEFGSIDDGVYDERDLQAQFDEITDSWHSLIDEIISKHYASQLYEYCRQVERNPQFKMSSYGLKIASDLMWIKRLYFLPYVRFQAVRGGRPALGSRLPKLFEIAERMHSLLGKVVVRIDSNERGEITSVKNWRDPYRFEIENPLSSRLKFLLGRNVPVKYNNEAVPNGSNAVLLLYTLSILSVLHYLINDKESFLYSDEETPLYRSEHGNRDMPLYSVPLLDTYAILQEAEQAQLDAGKKPSEEARNENRTEGTDPLTGLYDYIRLSEELRRQIEEYHTSKFPFSMIMTDIAHFTEYNENNGKEAGDLLLKQCAETIRRLADIHSGISFRGSNDEFFVVLPRTEKKTALSQAVSIVIEISEKTHLPAACSLVEFHKTWGAEKMVKMTERTLNETKQYPDATIGIYDTFQQSVSFIDPFTLRTREEL